MMYSVFMSSKYFDILVFNRSLLNPPSDLSLYDTTLSNDDVPTGSLVSPIMSPSLPDVSHAALATAASNGCATSRSEPSLVDHDNSDIFNNETHV